MRRLDDRLDLFAVLVVRHAENRGVRDAGGLQQHLLGYCRHGQNSSTAGSINADDPARISPHSAAVCGSSRWK